MARKKKIKKIEIAKKLWRKWETPPPPKEKFILRKKIAVEWREISFVEILIWFSAFVSVGHFAAYIDSWLGAIVVDFVIVLLTRSIIRNVEQRVFSFWEWFAILIYTAISTHANIDYYEKLGETNPYIKGALWPFSVLVLTLVKTSAVRLFNVRREKYDTKIEKTVREEKQISRAEKNRIRSRQRYHEKKALGILPKRKKIEKQEVEKTEQKTKRWAI